MADRVFRVVLRGDGQALRTVATYPVVPWPCGWTPQPRQAESRLSQDCLAA
jgi:hypothetical protein